VGTSVGDGISVGVGDAAGAASVGVAPAPPAG
jgi:hypothetical protein